MTFDEAIALLESYCDADGLVFPMVAAATDLKTSTSGNGLAYTALGAILLYCLFPARRNDIRAWLLAKIKPCEIAPGIYARTPTKAFGEESWDDYCLMACAFAILGEIPSPWRIIWYGIKHAFFFAVVSPLTWADFLGRFVFVWSMMFCAGFIPLSLWASMFFSLFLGKGDWKSWAYFKAIAVKTSTHFKDFDATALFVSYYGDSHALTVLYKATLNS